MKKSFIFLTISAFAVAEPTMPVSATNMPVPSIKPINMPVNMPTRPSNVPTQPASMPTPPTSMSVNMPQTMPNSMPANQNASPPVVIKLSPEDREIINLERKTYLQQQELQYIQSKMQTELNQLQTNLSMKSLQLQLQQYNKREHFNQKLPYAVIQIPGAGVVGNVILTNGIALPTPAKLLNNIVIVQNNVPYVGGNPVGVSYKIVNTQQDNNTSSMSAMLPTNSPTSGSSNNPSALPPLPPPPLSLK